MDTTSNIAPIGATTISTTDMSSSAVAEDSVAARHTEGAAEEIFPMTAAEKKAKQQRGLVRNGMPEIAQHRNRLGKMFISRMRADFQKHGIATIERVRKERPAAYLELVARLVPMQMDVNVNHTFMDLLREASRQYENKDKFIDAEVVPDEE